MATLDDLIAWRDALRQARFSGVQTAEINGKRVTYKSDEAMAAAIADLDDQIGDLQGTPRVRQVRVNSTKGV